MVSYLDFEKSLSEIEGKIRELNEIKLNSDDNNVSIDDISKLEKRSQDWLEEKYSNLSTWEKTQVARHPNRPHFTNYAEGILDDFVILSGDRLFGEDKAIIGGLGKIDNQSVMLIGHEKGNDTAILIDENNNITEGPGFNIFCVNESGIFTPDHGVLKGITRQTVFDLGNELNLSIFKKSN
mgnify:CR=1 FL=1